MVRPLKTRKKLSPESLITFTLADVPAVAAVANVSSLALVIDKLFVTNFIKNDKFFGLIYLHCNSFNNLYSLFGITLYVPVVLNL